MKLFDNIAHIFSKGANWYKEMAVPYHRIQPLGTAFDYWIFWSV